MLCVVRWLNWYIYITHVFYYTDTLSLSGSETTEIATRLLLLLFGCRSLSWDQRETLIMNEFHCIWYSIQHYLSLPLYGNHTTNVESSPRLWYRQKRSPLRCGHLRTDTLPPLSFCLSLYMQWMNLKCDSTTRPIKWILRLLHNVPPSTRPPEGTVQRDLHSDIVKW